MCALPPNKRMQLTRRGDLVGRLSKVALSSLSRASQLIRGVRRSRAAAPRSTDYGRRPRRHSAFDRLFSSAFGSLVQRVARIRRERISRVVLDRAPRSADFMHSR
jgi:hypothetical protein